MFMRTLLHGLLASAAAVLTIGAISGTVAAADPAPSDAPCRLAANVSFSLDPVGRTFGSGNVTCTGPVYQLTVQVTLTQDSRIVGTDRNLCQGVATCGATVATLNPAGPKPGAPPHPAPINSPQPARYSTSAQNASADKADRVTPRQSRSTPRVVQGLVARECSICTRRGSRLASPLCWE